LKSKYLLFFPARRVFRYAGMDVSELIILGSVSSNLLPSTAIELLTGCTYYTPCGLPNGLAHPYHSLVD